MKYWYAVHAKPRQENTAEQNLSRQGFDTYLPKIQVRRRRRDKWTKVVEPLFPRYLFVYADPDHQSLAPIRSTFGVAGLVRFGHLLRPVPDPVIAYLQQAEDPTSQQREASANPHQSGDTVEVLEGPFQGLTGIYQMQSGETRAMLLIELLGRTNQVTVDMDAIA